MEAFTDEEKTTLFNRVKEFFGKGVFFFLIEDRKATTVKQEIYHLSVHCFLYRQGSYAQAP